jgi:hypothetical protein
VKSRKQAIAMGLSGGDENIVGLSPDSYTVFSMDALSRLRPRPHETCLDRRSIPCARFASCSYEC